MLDKGLTRILYDFILLNYLQGPYFRGVSHPRFLKGQGFEGTLPNPQEAVPSPRTPASCLLSIPLAQPPTPRPSWTADVHLTSPPPAGCSGDAAASGKLSRAADEGCPVLFFGLPALITRTSEEVRESQCVALPWACSSRKSPW